MDEMKDQLMDMIVEYYLIVQQMMMMTLKMVNKLLAVNHLQQMFEIYLKHVVMVVKYHWTEVFVMLICYLDYQIYYLPV
jgi:hypothetical protein